MKSKLILSFSDQSPSFTYGVEFGMILQKMKLGLLEITNDGFPVRVENIKNLKTACIYYGYNYILGEEDQGWITFSAFKKISTDN